MKTPVNTLAAALALLGAACLPAPAAPGAALNKPVKLGAGANQITLTVTSAELAAEWTHKDAGGAATTEKEDSIHAWLLVRFSVRNAGRKPVPVWQETWGGGGAAPAYLQMGAVRDYTNESDDTAGHDYFDLWDKKFYRQSDGAALDTTSAGGKKNWVAPGQTVKAFAAFQVRKEAAPIVTGLQVNYQTLSGVGDPRQLDDKAKATLLTFDLSKTLGQ